MPQPIVIKNGKSTIRLYKVSNFMELPLATIRKFWRQMFGEAWSNTDAIAAIGDWLPQALLEEKARLPTLEQRLIDAKQDADAKRWAVAALGTALEERINRAKYRVKKAKDETSKAQARSELYEAKKPKTEHQQAVRAVRNLENQVKEVRHNQERLKKMQIIFTEMTKKAKS